MMILDRLKLDGKVALITGGGRGIGRGIANALSEAGATVVVTARSPDQIQDTVEELTTQGRRAIAIQADVTKREDNERAVQAVMSQFGRLDILVNNAGGSGTTGPFLELTEEQFRRDMDLNMLSAFTLTQIATPHLLESGGGSVINISSRAGSLAARGRLHYGVAKAALEHLTRRMAQELAPDIRVNALAIGTVLTAALQSGYDQGLDRAAMLASIPLEREGTIDEVGLAALFLCAEGCYVTGQILYLDGGLQGAPSSHGGVRLRARKAGD